jgi:predicted transcriptional regulator
MYYMKNSTLTIRLDAELERLLAEASRRTGRSKSDIARDALRRQVRLESFDALRRRVMPFAEARGYLTDEDIFSRLT